MDVFIYVSSSSIALPPFTPTAQWGVLQTRKMRAAWIAMDSDAIALCCSVHKAFSHQPLTMLVSELKLPEGIVPLLTQVFHLLF